MAQSKLPPVPRVEDPDKYLESVFGSSKDPQIPTFFEFMEKLRGVPMSKFSTQSLETLALIMETTFYSQYANMVSEMNKMNAAKDGSANGKAMENWADEVSVEEIDSALAALRTRYEQLENVRNQKVAA